MSKGKQVGSEVLVIYNSKVPQATKDTLTALVDVLKGGAISSQRELLEDMLVVYEKEHPETFKRARRLLAIKQEAAAERCGN